ncbi:TPA: HlyD family secretion protein [Legionella pneumophila]|uniref:HlyD family secretion protein n=1 Tax=Legionella pneumophila TaxID=446 RepID=UPI000787083F|nr:HlyD family efflux transporter periplasmic adaptor subunit [Legionella pneumophila]HAU1193238.1 HlyD family efflux transporter periplasmic adaptor subunit [Legionella pneumophila]HBD7103502.1 HlyD family efflux transporter periplasmic adaptor subunit [Legionella pneumophila]HCO4740101.1 HlyD family efflux transporter periplasmic adaptor subunit [Legionella pneumophila]HDU7930947.1 HlyD family efflux transporter periplasmic adaptor subunit [Legionella pneumophila]HDU7936991.1 HlyD family eff
MGINLKKVIDKSLSVTYGQSVRAYPRLRWFMVIALLSIPLIFLLYKLTQEYVLVHFPGLVVYDTLIIRSPEIGYIKDIQVKVGENVTPETVLLQFTSPEMDAKLQYLTNEKTRITNLMNALNATYQNKLNSVLDVAKKEIESSKEVYERFKNYVKKGDMVQLQLDEARRNYVDAQKQYANLQQQITESLLQNKTTMEVHFLRKLFEINNEIDRANIRIKFFTIRSPKQATVTSIQTHVGEFVSAGQNLMMLVTNDNLRIMAFIEPKYVDSVFRGQEVEIKFPDNYMIRGRIINTPSYAEQIPITEISPLATRQNKLIAVIKPISTLPQKYQVFGIPVKIYLQ